MPLYLVATPIGNLADISKRAEQTLASSRYVLCEDTRHSGKLLSHLGISTKLISYHKFNEKERLQSIIEDLQAGQEIALISDAGTPGISDPGQELVEACVDADIPVLAVPGPCAAIAALTISGLKTDRFQFVGFLPRKAGQQEALYQELLSYPGTSVCYESPQRIVKSMKLLSEIAPEVEVAIVREITKRFEQCLRGKAAELAHRLASTPIKGEIVLLIQGGTLALKSEWWERMPPEDHVEWLVQYQELSLNQAIKHVAKLRGLSRRELYASIHQGP